MSIDVTIPPAGESITTANVAQWHKNDGDSVVRGEVLVTLETDKVSNELEAEADGVLSIVVAEGEEVAIGTVIARIDDSQASGGQAGGDSAGGSAGDEAQPDASGSAGSSSADGEGASGDAADGGGEPVEIKVPAAGESIASANVAQWHKGDGETVAKGEALVTLETDKVSNELEAEIAGRLEILVAEGEEVKIGKVIGRIVPGGGGDSAPAAAMKAAAGREEEKPAPTGGEPAQPGAKPMPEAAGDSKPAAQPAKAAPAQTAPAKSDLAVVPKPQGGAPAKPAADEGGRTTRRKMSMLRRKIATHLVNAQHTAAILTTFNEADMAEVMRLRKQVQEEFIRKHGVKLGFMSFFVKAVVQALKDVPQVNGRIEGNEIVENHYYDIGVAIGTEKGLVVPVLRDCDRKSFAEIEQDILDYANKAREGTIQIEDLQGGVFTISNGGTYGSLLSTPILNPPQSGILGMHTIQQRPVAVDGEVVIRPMMYLAMSYDHRLVDGKEAVSFLIRIKDCIEHPARLMLEM